ncbi:hypothetical protein SAMN06297382_2656, partial [Amphiplicatus metriothermophilus]
MRLRRSGCGGDGGASVRGRTFPDGVARELTMSKS